MIGWTKQSKNNIKSRSNRNHNTQHLSKRINNTKQSSIRRNNSTITNTTSFSHNNTTSPPRHNTHKFISKTTMKQFDINKISKYYSLDPQSIEFIGSFLPTNQLQQATEPNTIILNLSSDLSTGSDPSKSLVNDNSNNSTVSMGYQNTKKTHNKGQNGRMILFGGSALYSGAPYFASKAATTIGSELIQIITEPTALTSLRSLNPDIMCHGALPSVDGFTQFFAHFPLSSSSPSTHPINPNNTSKKSHNQQHLLEDPQLTEIGSKIESFGLSLSVLKTKFQAFYPLNRCPIPLHSQLYPLLSNNNDNINSNAVDPIQFYLYHALMQAGNTASLKPLASSSSSSQSFRSSSSQSWWDWIQMTPPHPSQYPISYVMGPGLGQDPVTLSFMSNLATIALHSIPNLFVLDANALSLFNCYDFTRAFMKRPLVSLFQPAKETQDNKKDQNDHVDKRDQHTLTSFHNTILTPNHGELNRLYSTLVNNEINAMNLLDSEQKNAFKAHHRSLVKFHCNTPNTDNKQEDLLSNNDSESLSSTKSLVKSFTIQSVDKTLTIVPLPAFSHPNSPIWIPSNINSNNTRSNDSNHNNKNDSSSTSTSAQSFNDTLCHLVQPDTITDKTPLPPSIIENNDDINKAIAIARYLNGTTVYVKGQADMVTNGSVLVAIGLKSTSPSRCGGQGDITTGLISGFSSYVNQWWFGEESGDKKDDRELTNQQQDENHPTKSAPSLATQLKLNPFVTPTIISSILASYTLKLAAVESFKKHYTGTNADTILTEIPILSKSIKDALHVPDYDDDNNH